MPCRVGITTDIEERKTYWKSQYGVLVNFRILHICGTKEQAQSWENFYAKKHGCVSSPGGADAQGPWFVYYFEFS